MKISSQQWIAWIGATVTAAIIACAFLFQTFATKSEAMQINDGTEKRLDRIESKLDVLMERSQQ